MSSVQPQDRSPGTPTGLPAISAHANLVLSKWLQFHKDCPVPTEQDCSVLSKATGLTTDAVVGHLLSMGQQQQQSGDVRESQPLKPPGPVMNHVVSEPPQPSPPPPPPVRTPQQIGVGLLTPSMPVQPPPFPPSQQQQQQQLSGRSALFDTPLSALSCGLLPEAESALNGYVMKHLHDGMPPERDIITLATRLNLSMAVVVRAIMTKRAAFKSGLLNTQAQQHPVNVVSSPAATQAKGRSIGLGGENHMVKEPERLQQQPQVVTGGDTRPVARERVGRRFRRLAWGESPSVALDRLMLVPCEPKSISDRDMVSYCTTYAARLQTDILPPKHGSQSSQAAADDPTQAATPSMHSEEADDDEMKEEEEEEEGVVERRVSPRLSKRRRVTTPTDESYEDSEDDSEIEPTFPDD
ncbi:hypothetical protein FOZ63_029795 [Perkinsus olseni]|uniref:Uncharacterized protein n=1 Tax=Perkinsus olseni TaxID=32597 RepID=A0A7J6TJN4_PEROL|nr:hypothetical protein FOZ63_029795 [Perkinsus olseni]